MNKEKAKSKTKIIKKKLKKKKIVKNCKNLLSKIDLSKNKFNFIGEKTFAIFCIFHRYCWYFIKNKELTVLWTEK